VVVVGAVAAAFVLASGTDDGGKPAATGEVVMSGPARSDPLRIGDAVPDFAAPGLDGGRVSWSDYRGSPTVLVAWAPWCPHCQKELPVLDRVARDYPGVRLASVVTAIGLHPGPDPKEFMRENGMSFPVAVDDERGTLAAGLGVTGFPTLYAVDPGGTVIAVTMGESGEAAMWALFQQLSRLAA
jgi:peroxiredoxin